MGRTEPSIGRPPPAFRRDARAKKAKAIINKVIPSLLSAHPRARRGIDAADLIVSPKAQQPPNLVDGPLSPKHSSNAAPPSSSLRLTIRACDTLTAARSLLASPANTTKKVAILNMASPLSPGGGFLNGATSQEEYLCMRTTLLPSLSDEFYRLPEVGCVFTPDVLVFGDAGGDDLEKKDRWFVDVVSAAMLRLPETEVDENTGRGGYVNQKDRELVVEKMRAVLRVARLRGAQKVVLGAWGCGAYGNPVGEIARAWRRVLLGGGEGRGKRKRKVVKGAEVISETWESFEEVVFAISDAGMADGFQAAFGERLEWADEGDDQDASADGDDTEETRVKELQEIVAELQLRINRAPNDGMKSGLEAVLAGLKSQISEQNPAPDSEEDKVDDEDHELKEVDYDGSEQFEDHDEAISTDDDDEREAGVHEVNQGEMDRKQHL